MHVANFYPVLTQRSRADPALKHIIDCPGNSIPAFRALVLQRQPGRRRNEGFALRPRSRPHADPSTFGTWARPEPNLNRYLTGAEFVALDWTAPLVPLQFDGISHSCAPAHKSRMRG